MEAPNPPSITSFGTSNTGAPPSCAFLSDTYQPRQLQLQTGSMESLGSYQLDYDEVPRIVLPHQGRKRQRKRPLPGPDQVKHRRTRSGCYTCRQRRVKCDETHPICDKCRKGKRECAYPGSTSSTSKFTRGSHKDNASPDESISSYSDDENDAMEKNALSAIPDAMESDGDEGSDPDPPSLGTHKSSAAPSSYKTSATATPEDPQESSRKRPVRPQPSRSTSKHSTKPCGPEDIRWQALPKDVRAYLRYHRESLSYHHYGIKYDGGDFLKTTFLQIALNDDSAALLYGIVAFAAYHHTLTRDDDRISTFLSYYNKSITLLQHSLSKKRHNVATLLTILQLATIEEFLGDWVNLLGHQRAAHQILTDLFTPQTIMQDETRRKAISWYLRFDLFAGIMSGAGTILGREWFSAVSDFYQQQAHAKPDDLGARFEEYFAASQLLASDVAILFAAKTKNAISDERFAIDAGKLSAAFHSFGQRLETAFTDPSCFFRDFPPPSSQSRREEPLVDFRDPHFLYDGELFTMNFVLIDFWAIDLMFKYQLTLAQQQVPSQELTEIALKKQKMFEAIEHSNQGPPGALLGCQASLGILCLFLPKDQRHTDWCREKFALIERKGYIYPPTFRKRMADLWATADVTRWWLPDPRAYPSTIRAIRDFVAYRARTTTDAWSEDVRNMSGIFRSMNMAEDPAVPDDLRVGADSDTVDTAGEYSTKPARSSKTP